MNTNDLQAIVITNNSAKLNKDESDHLIASMIEYKNDTGRFPKEIIFNREMAERYFDEWIDGKQYPIKVNNSYITLIINPRLRSASILMR